MPGFFNRSSGGVENNQKNIKKSNTRLIGFLAIILLLIALPIVVIFSRNTQETRQRAAGGPNNQSSFNISQYTSCPAVPADIMLIIDRSGSMNSALKGDNITKIAAAKAAANSFIDIISQNTQNTVGLTTFSTTATLDSNLTTNFSSVKTQVSNIQANGNTCHQCAARTADDEIHKDGRANIKKVAILLTDGLANTIIGNPNKVSQQEAEAKALAEIQTGYNNDKISYFTIGLGNRNGGTEDGIDEKFLQQIATMTGGKYYYSPTSSDLNQIYQDISQIIGKGSISGTVFNDLNKNGVLDTGEPGLQSWTVNLKDESNTNLIATTQSGSDGSYSFTGICNQKYAVSEIVQSGWIQTSPPDPGYYKVTINNNENITGKDFGNTQSFCGVACKSDTDCAQANDGCTVCDPGSKKCAPATTPSPSACVTPGPVNNVQIMCANCGG